MRVCRPGSLGRKMTTMATRRRKSPEQIVRLLGQADAMLANGEDVAGVCRVLEISESSFHRWRNQYGDMKAEDAKRLKVLEREDFRLQRIVADQALDIDKLKGVNRGNF